MPRALISVDEAAWAAHFPHWQRPIPPKTMSQSQPFSVLVSSSSTAMGEVILIMKQFGILKYTYENSTDVRAVNAEVLLNHLDLVPRSLSWRGGRL